MVQLARILFCCFWVLFAAEWFVRLLAPMPMLPRYVQAAPFGIRMNMPNRQYFHRTPDYTIQIRTNGKGIRADYEIPYEKQIGIKRILLLGDSFGMGYEVNLEDTFLIQMCQHLEEAGYRVEPVNLSVSGHGNAEELIMLREEGLKFHPDLIILAWHETDIIDNIRSNLFELKNNQLERRNHEYLPGVKMREILFRIPAYEWIATHSQLYALLREKAAELIKNMLVSIKQGLKQRAVHTDKSPAARTDNGSKSIPILSSPEKLTLALLREIQQVANASGAEFVVLDIPKRINRAKFVSAFPPAAFGQLPFPVVSPLKTFAQHRGKLIYWERSHFHFTPLGTQLVGRELADYILQNKLLNSPQVDN